MQDAKRFIRSNLPVAAVPGIAEIRLHKALPSSRLGRLARGDAKGFGSPYWAYHWAGGLALARHILDNPGLVVGKRVLDLGAGSGVVAIAAAKAGANSVTAAETDPYAVAALDLNLELNAVAADVIAADITDSEPPPVDLVLVGDLFYSEALATRVTRFLDRCADAGIAALIGDPWRAPLRLEQLEEQARYEVAESGSPVPVAAGVFAFRPRGARFP
ncbi:MAG: methyltransferase [Bauldia sp.]|nr:methyltransferase [Bauldia sp.]